ncbi:MAG TPA: ABC transporter substrate-binding protein [Rhodopila sp.]|uniref:ABC transporter substrate-binding protein n=1 Tax=Rhodopila sp. TaxID=2480087 RepID=UPI002C49D52C|nr:ABC transporter substrate-binding protein [Rhodopila sp.]HVY17663.1 ABC transporter substrate-binding protein [Rhodopila sp.]
MFRRDLMAGIAAAAAIPALPVEAATGGTLRIAMTAADLPTAHGIPNNGFEGYRFLGYPPYDALVNWDLIHNPDKPANITPGLFTAWKIDPKNPLRWLFSVRQGVKFHDGSDFNADAVIWNLQRIYDEKSPHYDATSAPIVKAAVSMVAGYDKVDEETIAITTQYPFSFLPWLLTRVLMVSPTQFDAVGKSWAEFGKKPSGTGPFKISRVVPGQFIEMVRNENYWDKNRIPKLEKLVVSPMAEATTRIAALRSGQVDWIEVPAPDSIPSLKQAGYVVTTHPYPHTWPYCLNIEAGSPFQDVRVRQAANYAIDRVGLCDLLNGTAKPAVGLYPPDHPFFGTPAEKYTHDPNKAKALLAAAGYGPNKPCKAKIMISTSGSGQMLPIQMNEFLQQNFTAVGMQIDFDVVEWGTMLVAIRSDPKAPQSHGVQGVNISLSSVDPSTMFRYYAKDSWSPVNYNWGHYDSPAVTDLLKQAQASFDEGVQTKALASAHAKVVDDAAWVFIVHDLNPRAMTKKVQGFVPVESWFVDFTQISMA